LGQWDRNPCTALVFESIRSSATRQPPHISRGYRRGKAKTSLARSYPRRVEKYRLRVREKERESAEPSPAQPIESQLRRYANPRRSLPPRPPHSTEVEKAALPAKVYIKNDHRIPPIVASRGYALPKALLQ